MTLDELLELAAELREKDKACKICVRVCNAAGCQSSGADKVIDALQAKLSEHGLSEQVQLKSVGCMGLCSAGPLVEIESRGEQRRFLYREVQPADSSDLIQSLQRRAGGTTAAVPTDVPFFSRQVEDRAGKLRGDRSRTDRRLPGRRRLSGTRQGLVRDVAGGGPARSDRQRSARPRRRWLSVRPEMGHGRQSHVVAEVRHLQCGRRRSGSLHGSGGAGVRSASRAGRDGTGGVRRRGQSGLHLHPSRVSAWPSIACRPPFGRRRAAAFWARTSAKRHSLSRSNCGSVPVRLSAARKRP